MNLNDTSDAYLDQVAVRFSDELYFTHRELQAAFARVQNSEHWKNPIDATVTEPSLRGRVAIHAAIRFFTGSEPTAEVLGNDQYRFKADGYYVTIGA